MNAIAVWIDEKGREQSGLFGCRAMLEHIGNHPKEFVIVADEANDYNALALFKDGVWEFVNKFYERRLLRLARNQTA
jgi:hypothetical protein